MTSISGLQKSETCNMFRTSFAYSKWRDKIFKFSQLGAKKGGQWRSSPLKDAPTIDTW
jgi:hypothetical protein